MQLWETRESVKKSLPTCKTEEPVNILAGSSVLRYNNLLSVKIASLTVCYGCGKLYRDCFSSIAVVALPDLEPVLNRVWQSWLPLLLSHLMPLKTLLLIKSRLFLRRVP